MLQQPFSGMLFFLKERFQRLIKTPVCSACQEVLASAPAASAVSRELSDFCESCGSRLSLRDWQPVLAEHPIYAAATLTPTLKHWIYDHKFYQKTGFQAPLSALLTAAIETHLPLKSLVLTTVPPHQSGDPHASHFYPS